MILDGEDASAETKTDNPSSDEGNESDNGSENSESGTETKKPKKKATKPVKEEEIVNATLPEIKLDR